MTCSTKRWPPPWVVSCVASGRSPTSTATRCWPRPAAGTKRSRSSTSPSGCSAPDTAGACRRAVPAGRPAHPAGPHLRRRRAARRVARASAGHPGGSPPAPGAWPCATGRRAGSPPHRRDRRRVVARGSPAGRSSRNSGPSATCPPPGGGSDAGGAGRARQPTQRPGRRRVRPRNDGPRRRGSRATAPDGRQGTARAEGLRSAHQAGGGGPAADGRRTVQRRDRRAVVHLGQAWASC